MKKTTNIPTREEVGAESDLEKKLYTVEDMPPAEESNLYMPKGEGESKKLMDKVKEYWNIMKPHNIKDAVISAASPGGYILWKMPEKLHKSLNDLLGAATEVATLAGPEATAATGIVYGISQTLYGIKTRSGKHTGSGLVGIAKNMKDISKDEHRPIIEKIEGIIEKYFNNFQPKYAM